MSYPGQLYNVSSQISRTPSHQPLFAERTSHRGYQYSPTRLINTPPYPTTPPERMNERGHGQPNYFQSAPPPPAKQAQAFDRNVGNSSGQYLQSAGKRKVKYFDTKNFLLIFVIRRF
jgi:hypothetical protein